jgi:ADP-ribose pyrophosphatase
MKRQIYRGRIVNLAIEHVRLPTGVEIDLEMIRHPGAAAVVAATEAEVLLIRQYRYAAGGDLWEVPAGTLHAGELPEACARRELREEAGLEARDLVALGQIVTAPGFCDERIHIFLACSLRQVSLAHEADEVISEIRWIAWKHALEMIDAGEIVDAKTLVGLYHARRWLAAQPPEAG